MDTGNLTERSREALQEAQNVATRMGHTEVDGEHLLLALVDQQEGLVPRLLEQAGANVDALRSDLERELSRRPKVSGPGATPGQVMITQRLAKLLDAAEREAKRLKDSYVSVEHLVMALSEEGSTSAVIEQATGALMLVYGIPADRAFRRSHLVFPADQHPTSHDRRTTRHRIRRVRTPCGPTDPVRPPSAHRPPANPATGLSE